MSNPNDTVVVHDETDRNIAIKRTSDLCHAIRAKDVRKEDFFLALISLSLVYGIDVGGSLLRDFHALSQKADSGTKVTKVNL